MIVAERDDRRRSHAHLLLRGGLGLSVGCLGWKCVKVSTAFAEESCGRLLTAMTFHKRHWRLKQSSGRKRILFLSTTLSG